VAQNQTSCNESQGTVNPLQLLVTANSMLKVEFLACSTHVIKNPLPEGRGLDLMTYKARVESASSAKLTSRRGNHKRGVGEDIANREVS
jgi:hypothetical protein